MRNNLKVKRRVFIDTNVFVGCFRNVKADVLAMERLCKLQDSELFTSVLAISQTISTLQGKRRDLTYRKQIVDFIQKTMHNVQVIGMADFDIKKAMTMPETDIEDNIQFVVGEKAGCYTYITNNVKDFKYSRYNNVRILSPAQINGVALKPYKR